MSLGYAFAISGKGGVGKTITAALIISYLTKHGSVLAIDADPDFNLPQALGVNVAKTIGEVRESFLAHPAQAVKSGMNEWNAFELATIEVIEETLGFDLVVMGKPEGSGCYCGVNTILRGVIDSRADSYDFTVIDCEPGLEHLSRRTTRDVDIMLAITDATKNGFNAITRIKDLSMGLDVSFGKVMVVANRITPEKTELLNSLALAEGVEIEAVIPYDPELARLDAEGKPVLLLHEESPAAISVAKLCQTMLAWMSAPSL